MMMMMMLMMNNGNVMVEEIILQFFTPSRTTPTTTSGISKGRRRRHQPVDIVGNAKVNSRKTLLAKNEKHFARYLGKSENFVRVYQKSQVFFLLLFFLLPVSFRIGFVSFEYLKVREKTLLNLGRIYYIYFVEVILCNLE
jgi:hypothetical protein